MFLNNPSPCHWQMGWDARIASLRTVRPPFRLATTYRKQHYPRPVKTVSLLDETVFFVLEPDGEVNDTETKHTSTETNSSTDTFPEFPGVRSFKGHVFMTVVTTTTGHGFGNKRSATSWGSCTPDGRACKKC